MNKYVDIAKKLLGDDIFDEIKKSEIGSGIYKLGTNTATDINEIKVALQIVPKAIMNLLVLSLKHLKEGENTTIYLPFDNSYIEVTKYANDVYSGEIIKNSKKVSEFKYRSLPGIGLIIMSTFELYETTTPNTEMETPPQIGLEEKINDLINNRLKLHTLIKDVVDQRISEREAVQKMISERLSRDFIVDGIFPSENMSKEDYDELEEEGGEDFDEEDFDNEEDVEEDVINIPEKDDIMNISSKKSKLKAFIDSREKKRQEKIDLDKNEKINCPDCNTNIYGGGNHFKLCLCYGEHFNKEIKIKKTEDGKYKFKFPKSFNIDNIEMLLSVIKDNKNKK